MVRTVDMPRHEIKTPRTDEDLMAAYYAGETEALAEIYSRWSGQLYGYFRRLCWQHADAEDLIHDTFLKIAATSNVTAEKESPR